MEGSYSMFRVSSGRRPRRDNYVIMMANKNGEHHTVVAQISALPDLVLGVGEHVHWVSSKPGHRQVMTCCIQQLSRKVALRGFCLGGPVEVIHSHCMFACGSK